MANYRQIFRSTGLLGSVQVLYVLIAIVRNKLAALFIGAGGMGLADLYARTAELIASATNFGLGMSAVKQLSALYSESERTETVKNETEKEAETMSEKVSSLVSVIRTWVMLTALFGGLVCLLGSPVISRLVTDSTDHTAAFAWLAPMVVCSTLSGGEIAILKATRQLKRLASATVCSTISALVFSAPLYFFMGTRGIVPALLLSSAALFIFHLRQAVRSFPYRLSAPGMQLLRSGLPLLRLGTAFILAGVMTSGAEMLIRAFLMHSQADTRMVGLYAAGFALTVSYARIIFVAMDADFFPRLTAVVSNPREANLTINRQINLLVVLMAPFLLLFCLFLPVIVRVLYTAEFTAIIPMVTCAAPFMFFKAVYTPIAYLPLARGDSFLYMTMELIYNVIFCLLVMAGFHLYGLTGAGIALTLSNFFDLLLISTVYARRYRYRMNRNTFIRCLILTFALTAGLLCTCLSSLFWRTASCLLCLALMLPIALPILKKALLKK